MAVFRIGVYNGAREFRCQIGNPTELRATIRDNMVSTLWLTVPLDHPRIDELMADDARLKVEFKGEHLISGPVTEWEGETDGVAGYLTVAVEDDSRVLREILGWPAPSAAISDQGWREYKTYTGNAETIVKTVVTENGVNRLGIPGLTVAPNLNRGAVIPEGVAFRMHPLADQLFPAVTEAGLSVTVQQQGTNLVLDVREPVTHPRSLSVAGRTLKSARWTRTRPKASRAVTGGPGEGVERMFRTLTDPARETQYAMRAEVFQDARDAKDDAETGAVATVIMDARGQEALAENGPKSGVDLQLADSSIFQYGPGGFRVGDRIPINLGNGVTVTEVLRECTLSWVSPTHAKVEPQVGEIVNQPDQTLRQQVAALSRSKRDQERR
jgi:hypothetical protein